MSKKGVAVFLLFTNVFMGQYVFSKSIPKNSSQPVTIHERIVGGKEVSIQRHPYLAFIKTKMSFCGGSIISKTHILTAAHCVCEFPNPEFYWTRTGSADRMMGGKITNVSKIICHEKWSLYRHDIAILVLKESLQFDDKTKSIKMVKEDPEAGQEAQVSGWGLDNSRNYPRFSQATQVNVVMFCNPFFFLIPPEFFCAGTNTGSDSCFGDSGGPLVVGKKLAGVVSRGDQQCGRKYSPAYYTSVAYYRDWIRTNIKPKKVKKTKKKFDLDKFISELLDEND